MRRKLYHDEKKRFWQAFSGLTLLTFLVVGAIGIVWAYQHISQLENRLSTARIAIMSTNRDLTRERQTRLQLEKKLEKTQATLNHLKNKKSASASNSDNIPEEQRTPLPEYRDQTPETENKYSGILPLLKYGSTTSYVLFRGKCVGCP